MNNFETVANFQQALGDGNVVERWGKLGFLNGIDEFEKKYLADLYEALARSLVEKDGSFDYERIAENLKFNMLNATPFGSNTPYQRIEDMIEVISFPIIRRVYEVNKTFSFNEFAEFFNEIVVDNSFLNTVLPLNGEKIDGELEYTKFISNKIIEKLNK